MGSEMCIRDSLHVLGHVDADHVVVAVEQEAGQRLAQLGLADAGGCLLYTSDAADERSSVDLGGRRIIKKKNNQRSERGTSINRKNGKKLIGRYRTRSRE